jgi:hypothetical protein
MAPSAPTGHHRHRHQQRAITITTVVPSPPLPTTIDGPSPPAGLNNLTITPVGPSPPKGRHLQWEMAMITVDGQSPSPSWPTSFLLCAHPSPIGHHKSATLLPTNPLLLGWPITNWPPSIGHPIVYEAFFPGLPHIPSLPLLGQPITHTPSHIITHEHSSTEPPISPSTARHHRHELNGPSSSTDHHRRRGITTVITTARHRRRAITTLVTTGPHRRRTITTVITTGPHRHRRQTITTVTVDGPSTPSPSTDHHHRHR